MNYLPLLNLKHNISIWENGEKFAIPEWAASLIWLGDWCRTTQLPGNRLIVFVTLPTRELGASFAAFGAVLGGARSFVHSLSWPRFREKPIGSLVYWRERQGTKKFEGTILKFEEMYGTELITLQVTKPAAAAKRGDTTSIGRIKFDNYLFTEEEPPSSSKSLSFSRSENWYKTLLGGLNPSWILSDGAESILVTGMAGFKNAIVNLSLSCDDISQVSMLELLCIANSNESVQSKIRISHPRGKLDGKYPLAILDGLEAFNEAAHLSQTKNILTILDRSEFTEGTNDRLLELSSIAIEVPLENFGELPANFPPGLELAAYVVPMSELTNV